jgi:adenine-specific DNA-methyltransferase
VLLLAQGSGGCDAFSLYHVKDANDLVDIQRFDEVAVSLAAGGKWTDLLLSMRQRQLFRSVSAQHFCPLDEYGAPELGTVTGANHFFALSEFTRARFGLREGEEVVRISPPGTRHLRGLSFTNGDWQRLQDKDEAVWMLCPHVEKPSTGLQRYLRVGEAAGVPAAYKCQVRTPWWRPPAVSAPDIFFTYMSHRYPRLVANTAGVTFVNSMHGVRLRKGSPAIAKSALPLLAMNSVTMLGAEVFGRSYGGGILKMEPREAATLPMPAPAALAAAWKVLRPERASFDRLLRAGDWRAVVDRVDEVLLQGPVGMSATEVVELSGAASVLRARRMGRAASD